MNSIGRLRRKANLTQEQLAAALGVTQGTVSQWENGLSFPRSSKLKELARLFECPIEALYGEEGSADQELCNH